MTHLSRSQLRQWRDTPSESDRATIVGHLAVCDRCSAEYAELIRTQPLDTPHPRLNVADFVAAGAARRVSTIDRPRAFSTTPLRWAMAMAAALLLAVMSWQMFEGQRLRTELARAEAGRLAREQETVQQAQAERVRGEQLSRELQGERAARQALERELSLVSLVLVPGRVRGSGDTKTLTIPSGATSVRLVLDLGERRLLRDYEVTILNADGIAVWKGSGDPTADQLLTVSVPTRSLREDDYEITVRGAGAGGAFERVGDYYFGVRR